MGWLSNNGGGPEGDTSDSTRSSRSVSPDGGTERDVSAINSKTATKSQLILRLSTMEAAHMNRLHELTSQMADKELSYKEEARNRDAELQQSQSRVDAVECRIRERDVQVTALKEERAGCLRQIADLKNQLYQLQFEVEEATADKATAVHQHQALLAESQRELLEAKRALDDAIQSQLDAVSKASALEQEKNSLTKQLQTNTGSQAADLARLQNQLSELQSANTALTTQIAEAKANSAKNNKLNSKEISNLRSTLRARDDAIQNLQVRVEKGQGDMTALEAELDELRADKNKLAGERESSDKGMRSLCRENEEMGKLVENQNRALKDMTAKCDRQRKECEEQMILARRRGDEIETLRSALKDGEAKREVEREAHLARSESISQQNHTRVTTLEVDLQTVNERADELTSALNDAMEEIEDLQAGLVFKEEKIASLEREIVEVSNILKTGKVNEGEESAARTDSGSISRLRTEIASITREHTRLESEHKSQIESLKALRDSEVAQIKEELEGVRSRLAVESETAAKVKMQLQDAEVARDELSHELGKTMEVMDQLDAEEDCELEEMKEKVNELQLANDKLQYEIEELRVQLKDTERELAEREVDAGDDLREAREALLALDKERRSPSKVTYESAERARAELKALNEQLVVYKEQARSSAAEQNKIVREKEMEILDLKSELSFKRKHADELKEELESLRLSVERGPSKRNYGMSIDPEWHEPDTVSKLKAEVSTLGTEKRLMENELRVKIEARDATIASLVLTSSNQETTIVDLKSEVKRLESLVNSRVSSECAASEQKREADASRHMEVERLRDRTNNLANELKQTKRHLLSVSGELECARSQLAESDARPDVQDIAGRLVISEQAQKMLKAENADKLRERDSAIANLLTSLQANESVISNLRAEVESFKSKLNESIEENRRLQHESEIFATQIIDQDEEFVSLNSMLKEKSSEIISLKREIASSSSEIRNVKNLERQVDELKDQKRQNLDRVGELEMDLLKKTEDDGFELERIKLELKNAIDDKDSMEERLNKQIESLRRLRNHAVEDFESKLRQRDNQITSLEKELLELGEKMLEEDFDDIFLEDKTGGVRQTKKQLLEERDLLLVKIEALGKEIESLRVAEDSEQLSELRDRLAKSERLKEELEKDRSSFSSTKGKEMDQLRKQLSEAREAQTARETEQLSILKKLEAENADIRDEFTIRMKEKNATIVALEQTLAAQEQVVGNMSIEMDQLQNGMEKISVQRRAELEEMQQELMDYTSKATRLEREVVALSMKLDERKLKHKTEAAKLKDRIAQLEAESPLERIVRDGKHHDKRRENELEEKNDHLKWLNSSLKDENEKLKDKVEDLKKATSKAKKEETPTSSKQSAKNNDKWRNVALQEQVAVLSQRVIELEEAAATSATATVQGSRLSSQSPRPSILHSPVMRSSLENGSLSSMARASSSPKSALRPSTYDNDANQANRELLVNSDDVHQPGLSHSRPNPRNNGGSTKSVEKSKSSRFSLRTRSSKSGSMPPPKVDDLSTSTTQYDF